MLAEAAGLLVLIQLRWELPDREGLVVEVAVLGV
jgi:hypothetical protein